MSIQSPFHLFEDQPLLSTSLWLIGAILLAWIVRILGEAILKRLLSVLIARSKWQWDDALLQHGFFHRLAQVLMPLTVQFALPFIPHLSQQVLLLLRNITSASAILFVSLALNAVLNTLQFLYVTNARSGSRSIKSYLQIAKLSMFLIAAISIVSILINKSPLLLLSGLGAMSAVLLIVFRDTLLSFVASVQLASNDTLRVGDWIEMPQVSADGDVIDIALHTVKVQNWDNTITTIPTWRLIAESFKNWRGMQQSGGRRIKRSLRIDTHSVDFLSDEALGRLRHLGLLDDCMQGALPQAITQSSAAGGAAAQPQSLINIGVFRAYVLGYLKRHPDIHKEMICMVRQLEPGSEGVPIEVYCFTRTTEWLEYERIQGDVFDHLLAILPQFELLLFQNPSGADLRRCFAKRISAEH